MNCRMKTWVENGETTILLETTDPEKAAFVVEACRCACEETIPEAWRQARKAQQDLHDLLCFGNCNTCGLAYCCKFVPHPGEPVRANCPLYVRKIP